MYLAFHLSVILALSLAHFLNHSSSLQHQQYPQGIFHAAAVKLGERFPLLFLFEICDCAHCRAYCITNRKPLPCTKKKLLQILKDPMTCTTLGRLSNGTASRLESKINFMKNSKLLSQTSSHYWGKACTCVWHGTKDTSYVHLLHMCLGEISLER